MPFAGVICSSWPSRAKRARRFFGPRVRTGVHADVFGIDDDLPFATLVGRDERDCTHLERQQHAEDHERRERR